MTIITRFAPSPTGDLHIGGARTALFNYLFAKHHNGKFLLRIEDTDHERLSEKSISGITSGLKWLGLNWDSEPLFQSERKKRHQDVAEHLLSIKAAYYCFTPQEEIQKQRDEAKDKKQHFIFHSPWRDAKPADYPKGQLPVIRLKAPRLGQTTIKDHVQGEITVDNDHLDDMVLLRSDGTPTYMLAVVVDDHDMGVTHVIRGDDHLNNALRQALIYEAMDWNIPELVHIPLIHGPDGSKLSKRHGALGVMAYKEMGFLPEALNNYLLRLGWSHGDDEIISKKQAIEWFDIKGLGKSPARLDFDKMYNINSYYIKNSSPDFLLQHILKILEQQGYKLQQYDDNLILKAIPEMVTRAKTTIELAEMAKIFVTKTIKPNEEAKEVLENTNQELVRLVINSLKGIDDFSKEVIQGTLKELASEQQMKIGELMSPVRALITGQVNSPSVFAIMAIIGKEQTLARLKNYD